jgi:hypothetical protein
MIAGLAARDAARTIPAPKSIEKIAIILSSNREFSMDHVMRSDVRAAPGLSGKAGVVELLKREREVAAVHHEDAQDGNAAEDVERAVAAGFGQRA